MPVLTTNVNSRNIPEPQQQQPLSREPRPKRPSTQDTQPSQPKNAARRSSKPIINWFQRKLAGTKAKRPEHGKGRAAPIPLKVTNRVTSSPLPSPGFAAGRQHGRMETLAARRNTISLNGDEDGPRYSLNSNDEDEDTSDNSSMARESTWSPTSAMEADEDASLRPLPPSAPPSPSPSRSSSSYLSDPRTFKSIAASTKPTTLLSIDLNGNGMAHIAQAPLTPSQASRFPLHIRSSSTVTNPNLLSSGTFSALPPSPHSSRPPSVQNPVSQPAIASVQAPLHTTHHPRNNPRPSSPPLDNASVLTLASSAFALPGLRTPGWTSAPPSAMGASDSISHFGGSVIYADVESTSEDDRMDERDADASVRALRPRSSRRGSWESEASRWSARIQMGSGTPLTRERSVWTSNSVKTGGGFSAENGELEDTEPVEGTTTENSEQSVSSVPGPLDVASLSPTSEGEPTPKNPLSLDGPEPSRPQLERQSSSGTVARPSEEEDKHELVSVTTEENS